MKSNSIDKTVSKIKDTENKQAYNSINNSLLIDNMSDIFWIVNLQGEITFINAAVNDLLGYHRDEMIGRKLYEFMCPLHAYKVGSCKACVESMKEIEFNFEEMWMVHKDQKTRKVLEVNSNHIFQDGELLEIYGIGRDITSRIQYERQMKKKNKQMGIIQELTTSINQYLSLNNLDDLLDQTCKNMVTTMYVDLSSIYLIEDHKYILKGIYGKYKELLDESMFEMNESIRGQIMNQTQPFLYSLKENASNFKGLNLLSSDIDLMIFVPLTSNNKTVGVLMLLPGDKFEKDHLPLYAVLGNNIAFACEKSQLYQNQKKQYLDIIMTLVAAMEAKDSYTQGHSIRVSDYAVKIGQGLKLSNDSIEELRVAGILHDIGKFGVVNSILTKPGRLNFSEYEEIKKHPEIGIKILERIQISSTISEAILYHHLREDLKGYPKNTELKSQPLFAKIVGAADALDAMTSYRAYKVSMSTEEVIEEFKRFSGSQFNKEITEIVISLLENKEIVPFSTVER